MGAVGPREAAVESKGLIGESRTGARRRGEREREGKCGRWQRDSFPVVCLQAETYAKEVKVIELSVSS